MAERNPIVYVNGYPREIAGTDRVKNTGITRSGTAPSNPQDKDAWLDTSSGQIKVYQSGAWHSPNYLTSVNTDLVYDTTPQLGGNLDVNGRTITSANDGNIVLDPHGTGSIVVGAPFKTTSNGDIDLDPNGSGDVVIKGNSTRGAGAIQLNCEFNSHGIKLKSPPHSANASYTLTFPNDAGTNGYALTTNGSGTLSWTEQVPNGSITSAKLANDITIAGNLTVNGTTTTVNSTTLTVDDKNIELGSVSSPSDTTADGGGITLKGASDKTITWVNSTNCWTFNQSVNLTAGTASAPALILNGDVNTGFFQTAADEIAVGTAGSERLRVGSSGQIGIAGANYGTAGQVLTSGGSGAAPTWGNVSGSPTIEANATGAIADGDPVIIKTDGTVEKVTQTVGSTPNVVLGSTFNTADGDTIDTAYDSANDKWAILYTKSDSSRDLYVRMATHNADGTFTYGTPARAYGDLGTHASIAYNSIDDRFMIVFRAANNLSNRGEAVYAKYTNANDSWSFGTQYNWQSSAVWDNKVVYHPVSNSFVVICRKQSGSNYQPYLYVFTGDATSLAITGRNDGTLTSSTHYMPGLAYNSTDDVFLLHYVGSLPAGNSGALFTTNFSLSASYGLSFHSGVTVESSSSNAAVDFPRMVYDPDTNRFVIAYRKGSGVGKVALIQASSSTHQIAGSTTQFATNLDGNVYINIAYDTLENKPVIFYRNTSSNLAYCIATVASNGNSVSFGTPGEVSGSTLRPFTQDGVYNLAGMDPDRGKVVLACANKSSPNEPRLISFDTIPITTNLTADNFVGISSGAYSNGQTATIQVVGSADDAQSGLTAGTKYYVQQDGTLSSTADTPSVEAGVALSSTKLLIK